VLTFSRRASFDEDDADAAKVEGGTAAQRDVAMITIAIARDTDALDQTLSRLRLYFLLTILLLTSAVAVLVPVIVRARVAPAPCDRRARKFVESRIARHCISRE